MEVLIGDMSRAELMSALALKDRMHFANDYGAFFSKEYFENLLTEIREIRASERKFYQKITGIYATAMDYRVDAEITQMFFAAVQNKLHFAVHAHLRRTDRGAGG
jgi:hypothetical protein